MPPRGLGRGLESLIPTQAAASATPPSNETLTVPILKIHPSRYQPRQNFKEEALRELAESIKSQGVIQPLIVAPRNGSTDEFELIAGERRWRASQMAGLTQVPIVVKRVSEKEQFQMALIENLQREDLNPIEEALAFKKLIEEFKLTQEELSKIIGKGRVVIANTLRLLNLPETLKDAVANGAISAGHARNLVSLNDQDLQKEVAEKILQEHLTVRDVERIVASWKGASPKNESASVGFDKKDPETRQVQEELQQMLGTKVEIKVYGKGKDIKGSINVSYFSLEDLERLLKIFKGTAQS